MTQTHRLAQGGTIDRERPIMFTFDAQAYEGYADDTLASALLANGVKLVGRSFKYHRPRGIVTAGPEEPNALVTLRTGDRREPNTRATTIELFDGLHAESQNRWPSLAFDVNAINGLLAPLFAAGFYYKTFMWPGVKGWLFYERFIRRAAGLGVAAREPDPDRYERIEAFCDVAVVGAGAAGLTAALVAARSGARVLLVDENPFLGGALALGRSEPGGEAVIDWLNRVAVELASLPEVRVLTRTTAFGYYDGNVLGLIERVADHISTPPQHQPRQRHWVVRTRQVVLATGAIERPLLFANNDLPGVMLAGAARVYLQRYAVLAGRQIVVFSNNDSAYWAALELARAGAQVLVIDPRAANPALRAACQAAGVELRSHTIVTAVKGRQAVRAAVLRALRDGRAHGAPDTVLCDLVLSSGGWSPTIHLHSQGGSRPTFDHASQSFLPGTPRERWQAAGACTGEQRLEFALYQGLDAGRTAAEACGFAAAPLVLPALPAAQPTARLPPLWQLSGKGKCFVDLQNDVTTADITLAHREGYASAELLKRYTTQGMGTDQGKTGNVNALAVLAALRAESIPEVGVTTFRPPYTPIALGAIAGRQVGGHSNPTRYTPLQAWHLRHHADLTDSGHWKRPRCFARAGESRRAAALREAGQVRAAVGMVDISTLGKLEVQGPDAATLLQRVYVNKIDSLPVGKTRYGVMLREDGMVFDDGTVTRWEPSRFFVTTTTANAAAVLLHLEHLSQVVWPELRVALVDVTEQWAGIALAGPRSRDVLQATVDEGIDVSNAALPFMGARAATVEEVPVRILRVSFSGELTYEVFAPADYGEAMVALLLAAGEGAGITPYGLDAMDILRVEKGHLTGAEIDGNRTLDDLGLGRLARAERDFIGGPLMEREGLLDPRRPKLVGLRSREPNQPIAPGSQLVPDATLKTPCESWGHVSSACYSPTLGHEIALGFLRDGPQRLGQIVYAANPLAGQRVAVEVVAPQFVDPEGARLRG